MKKNKELILIVFLAFVLLFSAYNASDNNNTKKQNIEETVNSENGDSKNLPELEPIKISTETQNNTIISEPWLINCDSYSEYLETIENVDLPENFILYSQLEDIGEFCTFIAICNADYDVIYGQYWYRLTDENGNKLNLQITHTQDNTFVIDDLIGEEFEGMHNELDDNSITQNSNGYLVRNNMLYLYRDGIAKNIAWYSHGIKYELQNADSNSSNSDNTKDSFLLKLLNPQKAVAAAQSILPLNVSKSEGTSDNQGVIVATSTPVNKQESEATNSTPSPVATKQTEVTVPTATPSITAPSETSVIETEIK